MKSKQPNSAAHSAPASAVGSAPAVPISVYRELATELQATRAMVDSLNGKTQQLQQENQTLRQEMQRVVNSVLTLQPWVESMPNQPNGTIPFMDRLDSLERPSWEETAAASAIAAKLRNPVEPPPNWITEQSVTSPSVSQNATKPAGRLGGLWFTLLIIAIIVSAFGAGFMVMRPFLPTSR